MHLHCTFAFGHKRDGWGAVPYNSHIIFQPHVYTHLVCTEGFGMSVNIGSHPKLFIGDAVAHRYAYILVRDGRVSGHSISATWLSSKNTLISLLPMWLCEYNIQEPGHHYDNDNKNTYVISSRLYHPVVYVSVGNKMASLKNRIQHWYAMNFNIDGNVLNGIGNHQSSKVYYMISHTRFSTELWRLRKKQSYWIILYCSYRVW